MTVAFTFPGQGSQTVGMGKALAEAYPEARAVFAEVDDALGAKLSAVMWEGPAETLTLTENAQPALMAVSLAAVRVLESKGVVVKSKVAYVAGHSLGEYSALAAAGTLKLADAARLLRTRGRAMQEAVPVGAGQVVVSGSRAAVERAVEIAKAKGAKRAILLPVSAPFHCALMAPAAKVMEEALRAVDMKAPAVPLVANVVAGPISDPDEIRRRLVEQVTSMVRWRESIAWLAGAGVGVFVEVGAGKVLSGLAKRIADGAETLTVGAPDDIDAAVARLA
jgi:[acyl-carrier-protein] S-malonyltransferase